MKTVVVGDYVFRPIRNEFNNKTAYWISKKYCTLSLYCFTVYDKSDIKELDDKRIVDTYIDYLESHLKRAV